MPLRAHFRPPLDNLRHWEGFHATWPVMIVASLKPHLPSRFFAEPRTMSAASDKVHTLATDLPAQDNYEVLVYDEKRQSRPVAAVEVVSPANKEWPSQRAAFVAKCADLLRKRVSVVMLDIVTTHTSNRYAELLDYLDRSDPALIPTPPNLYAAACRVIRRDDEWLLETWTQPLALGEALPTMPLWLADDLAVPLELEASYEQSCGILGIP